MPALKQSLSFFDVMNLVIGAIVGADIYIAAAFGAGFLGPIDSTGNPCLYKILTRERINQGKRGDNI
jgi:hypothetical protein